MNPIAFVVSLPIKFYRKFISPNKPPCCRFTPTCSAYALEALSEWGVICGLALTVWRIIRCNPFCAGGYDPVPENRLKRKIREKIKNRRSKKNGGETNEDQTEDPNEDRKE